MSTPDPPIGRTTALVWLGTVVLFLGEHRLRSRLFPEHEFPGIAQQIRDTWSVWRRSS
jgi:hypothetical protein